MKTRLKLKNGVNLKNLGKGDTIVEVMISMVVLTLAIAATYTLSSRAYQSGLNAQYRDQATSLAQQQVELLKEADTSLPSNIGTYTSSPNVSYCVDPATKSRVTSSNPDDCLFSNFYKVTYKYIDATKTFQVIAKWDTTSGTSQQAVVYYKPRDSFNGSLQSACQPSSTDPLCASTRTDVPSIAVSVNPAQINVGATVTVTWDSINVNLGSCTATGPGGFSGTNVRSNHGDYVTTPISPEGSYNFQVACNDQAGNPVPPRPATLTVIRPYPDTSTSAANPISYNSATLNGTVNPQGFAISSCQFWFDRVSAYSFSHSLPGHGAAVNCSPSPGSTTASVTAALTGLTASTNYYFQLCATNSYGTTCSAGSSFTTTGSPPPGITAFGTWSERTIYTSQGVPRYIYWNTNSNTTSCNLSGPGANYTGLSPNSYVYINVYPGNYTLTCYNSSGNSTSANFNFSYTPSYFTAYQHASFDPSFPGWTWGPVGDGYRGIPGDTSAFDIYGRAAIRDNNGHCYQNTPGANWQRYGFVEWYGLVNDSFGTVDVGKGCDGL